MIMKSCLYKKFITLAVLVFIGLPAPLVASDIDTQTGEWREAMETAFRSNSNKQYYEALMNLVNIDGYNDGPASELVSMVTNEIARLATFGLTPPIVLDFSNGVEPAIPNDASSLANIGTGARVYAGNDSLRTFLGSGALTVTEGTNEITLSMGSSSVVTGTGAVVSGGDGNTATGDLSTVGGGQDNTASGMFATIGGGYGHTA